MGVKVYDPLFTRFIHSSNLNDAWQVLKSRSKSTLGGAVISSFGRFHAGFGVGKRILFKGHVIMISALTFDGCQ
ncbi:hypothetical protein MRB53_001685 [Persea americana]|uniref:Uncharacterized protein n=1 Tax=Persea americana TaxID=3435 RepID=A0ACC2MUR6_PERAE|nr:hypothetical protein MRB53_001685 [Persea americana]